MGSRSLFSGSKVANNSAGKPRVSGPNTKTSPSLSTAEKADCEPFVVTADGPDKPGLIAAMSRVFARHGVNIESLKAILGEGGTNQALFVFEVMVPNSVDMGRLRRELDCEGQKIGLRVSAQHRDIFEAVHRVSSF